MERGHTGILVLGELRVSGSGGVVPLPPSKKTRALLGFLAVSGRPQRREALCDLLWEGPDDPRASLRWSLTQLRTVLGPRLVSDRVHVAVTGGALDLEALRTRTRDGMERTPTAVLEECAGRYRGELLEGLDLPGCYRYQLWLDEAREAVRSVWRDLFASLVERLAGSDSAVHSARRLVVLDPLSEASHRALIGALAATGRRSEAAEHVAYARQVLRAELGVEPATLTLPGGGESERPARGNPDPGGPQVASSTAFPPPLVGREAEVAAFREALCASGTGTPPALLFSADPGMGKTRLLDELARLAEMGGGLALRARAFEVEMLRPWSLWIDAVGALPPGLLESRDKASLAPLLPGPTSGSARVDQGQMFEGVAGLLGRLTADRPVVILFDDLQWADGESLALAHFVLRSPGCRVLLAGALRPGELGDNVLAERFVRSLAREGRLRVVELPPLAAREVAALLDGVPGVDAGRVAEESEGNALFALEIARSMASGEPFAERSIDELIRTGFASFSADARQVLPWIAALGRSFRVEALECIAPIGVARLHAVVAELEQRRILRATVDGYDFGHDLVRRAAYRELSGPRRRLVHRHIARAVESFAAEDDAWAADLRYHAVLGGERGLATRAACAAGERCLRLFANVAALDFARMGQQDLVAVPAARRGTLHVALLRVEVLARSAARMPHPYDLEARLFAALGEGEREGRLEDVATTHQLLSVHYEDRGAIPRSREQSLLAAEVGRDAGTRQAVRHLANTARCLVSLEADVVRARTLLAEAESLARPARVDDTEILWCRGLLARWDGDPDVAREFLGEALGQARRDGDRWRETQCLVWLALTCIERGDAPTAVRWCDDLLRMADEAGEGAKVPFVESLRALALDGLGEDAAGADLERAFEDLRTADGKADLACVLNLAAQAALGLGDLERAWRLAAEALRNAEAVSRPSLVATARGLLALVMSAKDRSEDARTHLGAVAHLLAEEHSIDAFARAVLRLAQQRVEIAGAA